MRKQGDGARDNVRSELNDVTVKVVSGLSPRQTLTLKANYYSEDSNVTYSGLTEAEYRADTRQNPFRNDFFFGDRYGASATRSYALGKGSILTTQLYGVAFSRDWWRHSGQGPNDQADPRCAGMANLSTTCGNEGRLRDYYHWGVDSRLRLGHGAFGVMSEAELGGRIHFENQERVQQNGDRPDSRSGVLVEDNRRKNDAYSLFFQNRFLLRGLTLTPGLRVERVGYERTNRLAAGGRGVTGTTELTQWVPGLGASYAAGARATIFGGVHRGWSPPRTEDVINNTTGGVVELDAELSWNYELGVRSEPATGVRLDATFFRMDYQNQIIPASVAGGLGATLTNGGATLHQGFELTGRLDAGPLFASPHNVYARLAYTSIPTAEFRGARFSNVPGFSSVSVSGNRLPYAPERLLTAAFGYSHGAGLDLFLEAVHVAQQFADDLNTIAPSADGQRGLIPGYTILNATVNYRVERLRSTLFVTVKNLGDTHYIADRSRGIIPGTPRLVHAGWRFRL